MESNKIINYSAVSVLLTGNKKTIRSDRPNVPFSKEINELVGFVDDWVARNSKSKEAVLTIKTK